jgi:quercetin dioxygenase-like cupin family protein
VLLLTDDDSGSRMLPGGSTLEFRPFTTTYDLPEATPSLVFAHDGGESAAGRAGMRYRDLLPDRWGGRFVASHITIPDGGVVPDYVHFHKVRFQMIFVKAGWVRLVYEGQGDPFVMVAGDCVLQPPEIRHRVLESSQGLEVIEIGCPALHETIADWSLPLPNGTGDAAREWDGQTFVRHVAASAGYEPWRLAGWEYRDTGIDAATAGLAGVRVARVTTGSDDEVEHDTEFAILVVVSGEVTFAADGTEPVRLRNGSSVAIPAGTAYRLLEATPECELLDVTLPA